MKYSIQSLCKTIEDIEDSLRKAEASYQIWCGLRFEGMKDYKSVIDKYHLFFDCTRALMFGGMFIYIYRVFDKSKQSSQMTRLTNGLKAIEHINEAKKIDLKIKGNDPLIKRVRKIRNQSVAHREHAKTTKQIYEENPVEANQIGKLIKSAKEIVEIASNCIGRQPDLIYTEGAKDATLEILRELQEK